MKCMCDKYRHYQSQIWIQYDTMSSEKKNRTYECLACANSSTEQFPGITCVSSHYFCQDCFRTMFHNVIEQLTDKTSKSLPIKCPQCKEPYNPEKVAINLNVEQNLIYTELQLIHGCIKLREGEKFYHCKFCKDGYIMGKNADTYFCINQDCGRNHCLICMGEFTYKESDEEEQEFVDRRFERDDPQWHFFCHQFRRQIQLIQRAYFQGMTSQCSGCKKQGQKDQHCNHITCGQCGRGFCYICQKDWSTEHIKNYQTTGCPLFMDQLEQISPGFDDGDDPLMVFHRMKVMHYMKTALSSVKDRDLKLILNKLPTVMHGMDLDQIMMSDLNLYLRRRVRVFELAG